MPQLTNGLVKVIASFNRKLTARALLGKQGREILLTVWVAVLHVKSARAQLGLAVVAEEALGMEGLFEGVDTLAHDARLALVAAGREVELEIALTVQAALLLHEARVLQADATARLRAHKVIGTEDLADGAYEGAADERVAGVARGHVAGDGGVQDVAAE